MKTRLPLITPGTRDEMEGPGAGVTLRIRGAGSNVFLGRGRGVGRAAPQEASGEWLGDEGRAE